MRHLALLACLVLTACGDSGKGGDGDEGPLPVERGGPRVPFDPSSGLPAGMDRMPGLGDLAGLDGDMGHAAEINSRSLTDDDVERFVVTMKAYTGARGDRAKQNAAIKEGGFGVLTWGALSARIIGARMRLKMPGLAQDLPDAFKGDEELVKRHLAEIDAATKR
jgi:hypothetical protein